MQAGYIHCIPRIIEAERGHGKENRMSRVCVRVSLYTIFYISEGDDTRTLSKEE